MPMQLKEEYRRLEGTSLQALLAADPARARDFAFKVGPVYASFARQHYDRGAVARLLHAAEAAGWQAAMQALVAGEIVNPSEGRAALHTALRGELSQTLAARQASAKVHAALETMASAEQHLRSDGRITDVISVGVGGSDLGPRLVVDALARPEGGLRVHFVSNLDGHALHRVLDGLNPAHCAGVVISKSFGTEETLQNGQLLRQWLGDDERLWAVSANPERVTQTLGIAAARTLPMWDWVGGRYSLWSAVGFPIVLALGMAGFRALLAGAADFDRHALTAPPRHNLAYWHALTAIWNRNARGLSTQAVLPYDQRLALLPAYLQQLAMESLGKSVQCDGRPVRADTAPVWWGGVGTDCQHSFFQALHQGTQIVPAEFIGVVQPGHGFARQHQAVLANLLAQCEALANGQASTDGHRHYPGGRPSTLLLLDALTPAALGHLLALYEHSVYLQAVFWRINAFDQFGVELGKQLARRLQPALAGEVEADDAITREIIARLKG